MLGVREDIPRTRFVIFRERVDVFVPPLVELDPGAGVSDAETPNCANGGRLKSVLAVVSATLYDDALPGP